MYEGRIHKCNVTDVESYTVLKWSSCKAKLEKKENSSLKISKYQVKSEGVRFCGALGSSRSNELFITYLLFQIM